jgi:WD40 repeat protein
MDKTARVWNVDGTPLLTLRHEEWVMTACFSRDGETIVTGSQDRTARLWTRGGAETAVLRGHEGWVMAAQFSPRNDRIVTACLHGPVRVWFSSRTDLDELAERRSIRDFTTEERERYKELLGE